ncbi:raffinose synthase or seed imbibition protein Sip1-domain-containing protein [Tribonema minus]|uniref:galactinol--sucrose galactosyltransferase n=1 Tax=Tribonema minus TaxID=303371 RepID=A0A835YGP5_9STRA|nr:raffinose synthase or seed imbibition protein Sip1-domain-containing protein [Tribonema minus]
MDGRTCLRPQQLPPQREDDGGVRIQLGAYRAEPFQETTFPAQALYALQQLQSDEEVAFGAAFISLRRTEGTGGTCRWRLGRLNATRVVALHRCGTGGTCRWRLGRLNATRVWAATYRWCLGELNAMRVVALHRCLNATRVIALHRCAVSATLYFNIDLKGTGAQKKGVGGAAGGSGGSNAALVVTLHKFKLWWMKPTHGRRGSDVPPETQLLLSEMPPDPETGRRLYSLFIPLLDGPAKCSLFIPLLGGPAKCRYVGIIAQDNDIEGRCLDSLFIPLLNGPAKCSMKGLPDQHLQLLAETGCSKTPVPSSDFVGLFVAVHDDPYELLAKSFKLVQKRMASQVKGGALGGLIRDAEHALYKMKRHEVVKRVPDRSAPDMCNYLGWCTWDSFYTAVDSDKVFEGLSSLEAAGVKPRWLVLDDGERYFKVFKGLSSLEAAGVKPRWLVLDDGWQSTSNIKAKNGEQWMQEALLVMPSVCSQSSTRRSATDAVALAAGACSGHDHLTSLVANSKFRNEKHGLDLRDTVQKAKTEHDIKYFLVWHAIAGYWAGVDMDAPDLFKFRPQRARLTAPLDIVAVDPDMKMFFRVCKFLNKRFGVVPPEHIRAFYDEYHRYLRENGVDGVKVDAQSLLNFVGYNNGGSVEMSRAYHYALSKSVTRHFPDGDTARGSGRGGRIIHCMCHDNEILLTLPSCYARRPLIRGSDDFYPRDEASHGSHLYSNAFNALLIGHCGLQAKALDGFTHHALAGLRDWDMFQTTLGPVSWMHAASRAISGGPVYISDRPGAHDTDILKRIVLEAQRAHDTDMLKRIVLEVRQPRFSACVRSAHDADILKRTVLEDGGILRPVQNAMPAARTLFDNPQTQGGGLLTLWNENPAPGHGVLGAFNIRGSAWNQQRRAYAFNSASPDRAREEIRGSLSPRDCNVLIKQTRRPRHDHPLKTPHAHATPAVMEAAAAEAAAAAAAADENEIFAMYLHRRGKLLLLRLSDEVPIALGASQFELAAIARVTTLPGKAGVRWASVGLADMFNAGGAVLAERSSAAQNGAATTLSIDLKGAGRFLAHCSVRPTSVTLDGEELAFTHGPAVARPYSAAAAAAAAAARAKYAEAGGGDDVAPPPPGVPALEVEVPAGYAGTARRLQVMWSTAAPRQ